MKKPAEKQPKNQSPANKELLKELEKLKHDYGERIKELECHYGFSKIVETPSNTLDGILEKTNMLLPQALQYPEIACSRTVLGSQEFRTKDFVQAKWKQQVPIKVHRRKRGFIEVCYLEGKPTIAEDPFLIEERKLINAIAERLGRIIERTEAEEALQKGEQRWATTVDSIGDAIITTDLKGKVTFLNKVAEDLTGWSLADAEQKPLETVFNIVNAEKRKAESPVSRVLKEGKVVGLANDTILIRKNGAEVPIADSGAPIKDKEGKTTGAVMVFRDITERKKVENIVQQERKRLFNVLETVPAMVCLLTPDYHVPFANRAFKEKFGESEGRHCYDYCFGKEEPCGFCESYKVLETGKPHHWEVKGQDGSVIDVYDFPFTDTDGSPMILEFDLDITERRSAEAEVQQYATRMEELAAERALRLQEAERLAAIGATAGMVGHDIRNPLQSIVGNVFLAKSDVSALPESEEKKSLSVSLEEISANVTYINNIVQDLQDFASPIAVVAQETDLEALCESVLFKNNLPDNIEGSYRVEKNARKKLTDPALLSRILSNLISNSVQAMSEGGKLYLHTFKEGNATVITVEDTGCGIPENIGPKLFTPLFTTKPKGQGFGLAVVKRVTEALGGTVTYESEEGKGTKFILRFP
ncbi:MAG: PAS domain S-box protein [Candidatus Bathyarchaeota archaeon]|nr:PAS domain S-box protein [Candidatus Bathyarchaeota archaeon]